MKVAPKGKAQPVPIKLRPWSKTVDPASAYLFETEGPAGFDGGTRLAITLKFQGSVSGELAVSVTTLPRPVKMEGPAVPQRDGEIRTLLNAEKGKLTAKNREGILHWLREDAEIDKIYKAVEVHAAKAPQPNLVTVFAATANKGGEVNFLIRGEVEKKGPIAKPGFVQVLMTSADADQHWTGSRHVCASPWPTGSSTPIRGPATCWPASSSTGSGSITWAGASSARPTISASRAIRRHTPSCSIISHGS